SHYNYYLNQLTVCNSQSQDSDFLSLFYSMNPGESHLINYIQTDQTEIDFIPNNMDCEFTDHGISIHYCTIYPLYLSCLSFQSSYNEEILRSDSLRAPPRAEIA
ncbi:hypothetical protein ACFLRI_04935, partial [Bacteroidota bacterium]